MSHDYHVTQTEERLRTCKNSLIAVGQLIGKRQKGILLQVCGHTSVGVKGAQGGCCCWAIWDLS